jgi:hypothetical protein
MGRPTDYTPELAAKICERLADGWSLRQICGEDDMPDKATVLRWIPKFPEFRDQYARAREAQAEFWLDEILEIADDGSNDWVERQRKDGSTYEAIDQEHINRSRLRVDSRKWIMSKLLPKKYGDKVDLQHTGADGGPIHIVTGVPRAGDN